MHPEPLVLPAAPEPPARTAAIEATPSRVRIVLVIPLPSDRRSTICGGSMKHRTPSGKFEV
jgi:hypothetical protein